MNHLFNAGRLFVLSVLTAVVVTACATTSMIETGGAFQRTVERVLHRHDAYVTADQNISDAEANDALQQSGGVRALMALPEVDGNVMAAALEPVMERHDRYVNADPMLDAEERAVYLASTIRLRGVFSAVPVPALSE